MNTTRRAWRVGVIAGLVLVGSGCGGGSDTEDAGVDATSTEAPSDRVDDAITSDDAGDASDDVTSEDTSAPDDSSTEADDPPAPSSTIAGPEGTPLVEGVEPIELLGPPEIDAGVAPLFQWAAVDGAATYRLAVLGPDGPIWSWTGDTTEVYLGGLDFEQPAGWAGPQIVEGSCWSVAARDAAGDVIAVSSFVSVSPGPEAGPACVPPGR